ncbi:MAG: hypothetical protein ACOYBH_01775 [Candidatus Alectryocaccobium sp.]|jgi:hypothetical protein
MSLSEVCFFFVASYATPGAGAIIFLTIYDEYLLLNIVFLMFTSYIALRSEAGTIAGTTLSNNR